MIPHSYIIAEAGVNHNGVLSYAKELIKSAKDCGADAVKFQTFKTGKLVSKTAPKAHYQKKSTPRADSQFQMLKKLELSQAEFRELYQFAKITGIDFLSTPFDQESCDFLDELKIKSFKIGSGEITNLPFLMHIARKKRPVILSTGMSTLAEIENALAAIYSTGNTNVTLLHCVTEYPAPFNEINLTAMNTLKAAFKVPVGYSDHSPGIEIAIAAVAMGAEIIEKHFTLDRNLKGPDHKASLEPREFKEMVRSIRNVEAALGDGIKRPTASELNNLVVARKSIHPSRKLKKGHILQIEDLVMKRPGNGLSASFIPLILGRKIKEDMSYDNMINLSDLE
jgi:N,N'-diacetyllegionaminate synthase